MPISFSLGRQISASGIFAWPGDNKLKKLSIPDRFWPRTHQNWPGKASNKGIFKSGVFIFAIFIVVFNQVPGISSSWNLYLIVFIVKIVILFEQLILQNI